jgi:uncharacterized membrane protein (UPF0136 family)
MKIAAIIIFMYGLITLLFGIYWLIVDNNFLALVFGVAVGIIMFGNAYTAYQNNYTGIYITIILSLALTIVFALRFTKSVTILPGGIMFLGSIITLGFCVFSLSYKMHHNKEK